MVDREKRLPELCPQRVLRSVGTQTLGSGPVSPLLHQRGFTVGERAKTMIGAWPSIIRIEHKVIGCIRKKEIGRIRKKEAKVKETQTRSRVKTFIHELSN